MSRSHTFSAALASATLGLAACGGGNTGVPVSCNAPALADIVPATAGTLKWATPCITASSGGGSSRYDLTSTTTGCLPLSLTKMDFTDATCTAGATQSATVYSLTFPGTTTTKGVASTANDADTSVSGNGMEMTFTKLTGPGTGTMPTSATVPYLGRTISASVPFSSNGNYIICKSYASTNATRTVANFAGLSGTSTFTPTHALLFTVVNRTEVETNLKFDGPL
jgi:hypothetical protein